MPDTRHENRTRNWAGMLAGFIAAVASVTSIMTYFGVEFVRKKDEQRREAVIYSTADRLSPEDRDKFNAIMRALEAQISAVSSGKSLNAAGSTAAEVVSSQIRTLDREDLRGRIEMSKANTARVCGNHHFAFSGVTPRGMVYVLTDGRKWAVPAGGRQTINGVTATIVRVEDDNLIVDIDCPVSAS